jgi:tRNA A37 threonylcarbamoyladenosine synthetase subunit TsaC/SUA5/YrdC
MKQDEIEKAYEIVKGGGLIICPTRVGYILVGASARALKRKFELKERAEKKSAVVLTNYTQLPGIAQIPPQHKRFIDGIEHIQILCGFILKRNDRAFSHLDGRIQALTQQPDNSSCFVIHHGVYSEYLAKRAAKDGIFVFASSANKSGTGNRGRFKNIGDRIVGGVDYAIEHDEYVAQDYEPDSGEQGVMVSFITPKPTVIRRGLKLQLITDLLTDIYGADGWIMDHGAHP